MPDQEPATPNLESLLSEFAAQAESWFKHSPFVFEYSQFIQTFFKSENLQKAEWPDFQELANRLHSFNSVKLAKMRAFGKPNYPIEKYRASFDFLAHGPGSEEERMRAFMGDKEKYASKYIGPSVVSELIGQLFPDKYLFMNQRDTGAAEFLGVHPTFAVGADFPQRFTAFNAAMAPLFDEYRRVVGFQSGAPIGLEVDQFLSWLYETKIPKKSGDIPKSDGRQIWVFAPGPQARFWKDCSDQSIAVYGGDLLGPLDAYPTKEEILQKLKVLYQMDVEPTNDARAAWEFCRIMKDGDLVIAKKGNRKIVGVGIHEESGKGECIRFKILRHLEKPRSLLELKAIPALADCGPVQGNRQGSLYKLTKIEFDTILGTGPVEDEEETSEEDESALEYSVQDAVKDLFVSEFLVSEWLGQWECEKNLILQGPPGVGKTFFAKRLAYALMKEMDPKQVSMVQFHQSYGYEDFVQGIRPQSEGGFALRNGVFYDFCIKARQSPKKHVFIIDEINRGNISRIFGELLMLIENDKRGENYALKLAYQEGSQTFFVPENVYILGLMNTADRSLAVVDYGMRLTNAPVNRR